MFNDRYQITLPLQVISPLHLGTGAFRPEPKLAYDDNQGKKVTPDVATVVKDHNGKPYIPGTTIKGILRSLVNSDDIVSDQLFGATEANIKLDENDPSNNPLALMAQAYFLNAYIDRSSIPDKAANLHDQLPLYDQQTATAVIARNSIDRMTGAAKDKHLFYMEVVPPGTRFNMRLTLFNNKDKCNGTIHLLTALLQHLTNEQGISFGRNQSSGFGRLKALYDKIEIRYQSLNQAGELTSKEVSLSDFSKTTVLSLNKPARTVRLKLKGQGPFIIIGDRIESKQNSDETHEAQLKPLKLNADEAWLPGTSLKGVLRSEALYLVARQQLESTGSATTENEIDSRTKVLNPRSRHNDSVTNVDDLSAVEQLFGIAGWRAQLQIEQIKLCNQPDEIDLTSARLDRFSGGPIDNALFTTRAVLKPEFKVILSLEKRDQQDQTKVNKLFDELINHICNKGLILGHGGNKGFGWFEVAVEEADQNA